MRKEQKKILQIIPADNYWLRCTRKHEKVKDLEDVYHLKVVCFALIEYEDHPRIGHQDVLEMVNCGHLIEFAIDTPDADEIIYSEKEPKDLWHDDEGKLIKELC